MGRASRCCCWPSLLIACVQYDKVTHQTNRIRQISIRQISIRQIADTATTLIAHSFNEWKIYPLKKDRQSKSSIGSNFPPLRYYSGRDIHSLDIQAKHCRMTTSRDQSDNCNAISIPTSGPFRVEKEILLGYSSCSIGYLTSLPFIPIILPSAIPALEKNKIALMNPQLYFRWSGWWLYVISCVGKTCCLAP